MPMHGQVFRQTWLHAQRCCGASIVGANTVTSSFTAFGAHGEEAARARLEKQAMSIRDSGDGSVLTEIKGAGARQRQASAMSKVAARLPLSRCACATFLIVARHSVVPRNKESCLPQTSQLRRRLPVPCPLSVHVDESDCRHCLDKGLNKLYSRGNMKCTLSRIAVVVCRYSPYQEDA